jgi:hypothetical protein
MSGITAVGQGLQAWTLGLVLTMVLLDVGPGFSRDHPSYMRRLSGAAVGPMSGMSLALLLPECSLWQVLMTCAPFSVLAIWYSWAWWFRWPARQRRSVGIQAAVVGTISLLLLMLTGGMGEWNGGVVAAAFIASAGLLGGFTVLTLRAWTAGLPDEVPECESALEIPFKVVGVGLGITLLACLEAAGPLLAGDSPLVYVLRLWILLSLAVPVAALAAGRRLWPRFGRLVWSAALVSAVVGQGAIHGLLVTGPVLVAGGLP